VVGSGSSVQDFAGADVIVRLMSSMVQRSKLLKDTSACVSIVCAVPPAVDRRTASTVVAV